MQRLRTLFRLSQPLNLFFAVLTYSLGAGIARYLGNLNQPVVFFLGLGGILLAQLSMSLLAEVYRPLNEPINPDETRFEREAVRTAAMLVAITALAAAALVVVLLRQEEILSLVAVLFLGLSLVTVIAYAVPPLRLVNRGFGEFAMAVHLAFIVPSLGFVLQVGVYHRLVGIVSFPLTLLALAYFLVMDFPSFASDQRYGRVTLLRRMTWERAVPLHHVLLVVSYLLLASALLTGISFRLIWPAFLTLPFALLQIFWLRNISLGVRPIWNLLTINAMAVFGLTAYLLTFSFWLR